MGIEQRQHTRFNFRKQHRTVHISSANEIVKNVVISRNMSASGFCFRASHPYKIGRIILVHLKDGQIEDLKINKAKVIKAGNYVMAEVKWSVFISGEAVPIYEIGCSFVDRTTQNKEALETFVKLINIDTADRI
ncbi:PilZ domain-containing protein [bacterium]|nr:PilZ domain-containing protein [bacterium]